MFRSDQPNRPANCLFKPALSMTLQGAKWATFGEKRYKFGAGQALMVGVRHTFARPRPICSLAGQTSLHGIQAYYELRIHCILSKVYSV
jgi:hypothetical protein